MSKIKAGDIVEIATPRGLAYAQYICRNPLMGSMIRVLSGLHDEKPDDFGAVAAGEVQFYVFFPLQAAIKKGLVRVVSNQEIPREAKEFPLFRAGAVDPVTKRVKDWWLWDGQKEWRVGQLSAEQRRLPIRGAWNDTLLIERIMSGYRPEDDPI